MKRVVLGLSGGMDSSSLLASLLNSDYQFVYCYAFDYGQRHRIELERAEQLTNYLIYQGYPLDFQIINLRDVFSDSQSALNSNSNIKVPKEEYNEVNLRATVVENRNVIFSSIVYCKALSISKKFNCDVDIALGVHNNDESVYPDCRPQSTEMAKELFRISNYGSERIDYITPFIMDTKVQVLTKGLNALKNLNITYSEFYKRTSSCYDPIYETTHNVKPCLKCATCLDRLEAFKQNGLVDPLTVETQ